MVRAVGLAALFLLGTAGATTAFAQQPAPVQGPPTEPASLKERLMKRLQEPDQGGGLHFTKHVAVVFGDVKEGSGVALGPALSQKLANGAYTQIKAVYSIHRFRLLQARYDTRPFWQGRAIVVSRVRWQDAPRLALFRLGPDAPGLSVEYKERKTEGSARINVRLAPLLRVAGGFGIERYATGAGRIDLAEDQQLPAVPPMPGLGTHPWFAHTFLSAALDSRKSPDYSRSGRLVEAAIHDYRDWHDGQGAFERAEGTVAQLVPTYGARGVIDVSAQTWLSRSTGSRSVPFFLMPTLGGASGLLAYKAYRFRDRNALLLKAEYRWAVHQMIDVAGVYEAGKVAPTARGLGLNHAASSVGGGIRVHSKTSGLVSLDVAHGRDGFGFAVGFTAGGS
ncbi:MAG TPA: hypothetical protein VF921_07330 [Vicinamibacterales bacterium]